MTTDQSITVQVRGGIGNQLFIYAMGRSLALANGVPLRLDMASGFSGDRYERAYGLGAFETAGVEFAGDRQPRLKRRVAILANQLLPFPYRWYFRESPGRFDERYLGLRVGRPIVLDGYWQDERYFAGFRTEIKRELAFRGVHTARNEDLAREMRGSESVAVHARRLDVESLPAEYYRWAYRKIKERTGCPRFFLFSDCRSWSPSGSFGEDTVRVENEGGTAQFEDLWLMSQCRHFVVANSTFSWWGAWLGRTQESIVVSPVMQEWSQIVRLPDSWRALEWSRKTAEGTDSAHGSGRRISSACAFRSSAEPPGADL